MSAAVSIIIPVCNQVGYSRLSMDYHARNTPAGVEFIIIDNASQDNTGEFFKSLSKNMNIRYERNSSNLGPILALNQGIKLSRADIVIAVHNDLIVFAKGWVDTVINTLMGDKHIGLGGIAGRKIIDKRGVVDERSLAHSLINEGLNPPMQTLVEEVVVLDGVFISGRREVLNELGGFDEVYGLMHFYDLDISMKSKSAGYKNVVMNIEALHINNGGITRKTGLYKSMVPDDIKLQNKNSKIFYSKWKHMLAGR